MWFLISPPLSTVYFYFFLPAAAIIGSAVMTSHSMARLEYRVPLVAFTALHQAATAAWLGGLPYLLIAIGRAPTPQFARDLSARFSKLALVSVAVLGCAGFVLSVAYVRSLNSLSAPSYTALAPTKPPLF